MPARDSNTPEDCVDPTANAASTGGDDDSRFESILHELARGDPSVGPGALLAPGKIVAERFEIEREIGRGGFAKVFRARDRVLSRPVAIKLLARRRRMTDRQLDLFHREARATARLNHVNIVTLHDWGEWNGVPFLVLELLEGEPLSAVIARGPLAESRAWDVIGQVARAVAHAHGHGVLHLDLKSQNVFVLGDGRIKVLDFGLAGLEWTDEEVPAGAARIAGGTPATMAPEQASTGPTDARTDVWSAGVILYQMLVGRLPKLAGDSATVETPPGTSRRAELVLRRTLARDPGDRFTDAKSLVAAIETSSPRPTRRAALVGAGAAAVIGAGATVAVIAAADETPATRGFVAPPPEQHRQLTFTGDVRESDLSHDGSTLTYISRTRELWIQRIDGGDARKIFTSDHDLTRPRWLPDDKQVVVSEERHPRAWSVSLETGDATPLPAGRIHNVAMPDGRLASAWDTTRTKHDLQIAGLDGTDPALVPIPDTIRFVHDIDVARDGRIVLATQQPPRGELWSVQAGVTPSLLVAYDGAISSARWHADGTGVFFVGGDRNALALRWLPISPPGTAIDLVTGIGVGPLLSVARDGRRLVYHREIASSNLSLQRRDGERVPLTTGTAEVSSPFPSSDDREVLYAIRHGDRYAIMAIAITTDAPARRLIECADQCAAPAWSSDRDRIAFLARGPTGWRVVIARGDGTAHRVMDDSRPTTAAWGSRIAWLSATEVIYMGSGSEVLRVVDSETGIDRPFFVEPTEGWMFDPRVSRDGKLVAFTWTHRRGARGVYVADRSGSAPKLVLPEAWPTEWRDDNKTLVVLIWTGMRYTVSINEFREIDTETGTTVHSSKPPPGIRVGDASAIPGTGDLVLVEEEDRSDAWLIDDPLGRAKR